MEARVDIRNLNREELKDLVRDLGKETYRAQQIIQWIYRHRVHAFQEMTNLSKDLRNLLQAKTRVGRLETEDVETSQDGSRKFLLVLGDGERVESVLIPDKKRLTLCVSTQVGCALGCRFCLTGQEGFRRSLTPGEIVGQILAVQDTLESAGLTNIVLMGMGEPLANFASTIKALEIMTYSEGLGFSKRKITLSTAGLVPMIEKLGQSPRHCRLAVSLNAADNRTRSTLMPINRKYPLEDLLAACRRFPLAPRERITFEYVLIRGINDTPEDARRLSKILHGVRSKVNLIPYNPSPGLPFERPEEESVLAFQEVLVERHVTAMTRKSRGTDISAACGQLTSSR